MKGPTILYEKVPLDLLKQITMYCLVDIKSWTYYMIDGNVKALEFLYTNKFNEYYNGTAYFNLAIKYSNPKVIRWFVERTDYRVNLYNIDSILPLRSKNDVYILEILRILDKSRMFCLWDHFSEPEPKWIYLFYSTPLLLFISKFEKHLSYRYF